MKYAIVVRAYLKNNPNPRHFPMNFKIVAPLLVSAIALFGAGAANAQVETERLTTSFECVTAGRDYATIARRGDRVTPPLFVWRTTEFGRDYTPAQRCDIVTERLNNAVAQNGGRFGNLMLTTGTVNRLPVVCSVNSERERCNSRNLLFTLDRRNASNPQAALERLINFGVTGTGDPVISLAPTGGNLIPRSSRHIRLDRVVNEAFAATRDNDPRVTPEPVDNGI